MCLFDSAEGYGGGSSEERLRWLRKGSSEALMATKFLPTLWRWSERSFRRALSRSRERLGGCVELYFLHTPIHPRPLEFWVGCLCRAKKEGLVREIGISNCNASQVRRACEEAKRHGQRIAANQIMFNLRLDSVPI